MTDEDQQIAAARWRDEQRAQQLGDYTPVEQSLATAEERAEIWRQVVEFLERVGFSGPDELAIPALRLLERIRALP